MEEQDNISILYGKMQDKGLVKSGSEDDFRAYLNEGDNWQSVYDKISSPDVNLVKSGSADDFHAWLGLSGGQQEEPKPQATTAQPQATPQATPQAAQQPNEYAQKMAYNPYGEVSAPYIGMQATPTEEIPEQYREAYSKMSPSEQRVFSKSLAKQQQMETPEGRRKAAQDMRDVAGSLGKRDPNRKKLMDQADALDHSEDALRTPDEMRALEKKEEENEKNKKLTWDEDFADEVDYSPEYYATKKEAQRIKDEQYRAIEGRAVAMGKHTDNYTKGSDIYRDATAIFDQTDEGKMYNDKLENSIQLDRDDFAMSMLNSDNEEMKEVAQMYSQFGDIEREGQQLAALNESLKERAKTLDTTNEDAVNKYNKDVEAAQKRYDAYLKQIEEYDKLRKGGALDKYNEAFQQYITENDESATKGVLQEKNDAMTAMFSDWIDRKSIPLKKKVSKDFTDEIEKRINERRDESVEVPIYLLNDPMQNPLGISGRKTESGALTTAAQYTKKAQDLISNDDQNLYANSLVKGATDTAGDMDFWTFGMNEAVRGFISKDIMDKVVAGKDQLNEDERRAYDSAVDKGYKNLTPEEEAATEKAAQLGRENLNEDEKLAYDAMQNYWQVQQLFKPSGWYTAGQVTAEALPFIVAMWGSGGIVNAIKGGAKSAEKVALRQAAKQAEKMTFKQAAKNVGKAAGNMALEGAVYASTTGLPHTVAGTLEYLMPQSNATYDLEEGGIKVNRLEESEDSVLSAAAKSWGTQMIEGMSEAFSTYGLEPMEAKAYARLFGKTSEELAKGGNRAYKDIVRAAFKKGSMGDGIFRNVSSFPNEYIEELFGGFARCVVGLSEWDDEFSGETLAQTAYGLLPMQVVFSAMGGGNLRKHRQRMRQAEQFLDEFSPDSKALYDRLSGMSTYEGQDLLDREILSIQQEVDALKQADKFTPEMQQKMAARMNMALVMKEQLYMDEAAATIKEEQQRNAYEAATSNLNEQNGNLVYAEYKDEDGNNKRGWIISQDGENTVISDGKKRFKVKSSDVTELEEYTMEEVEDHIIGEGGHFAIEAEEDIANPVAGRDYYDHRDDTPLVLEGGGMLHVDEVDDDGNVTFTLNGRQATVSRRQFREIVQQSRNNMEYAEADTKAFNEIGKGMQSVAVRSEDPMLNAQLGRRGRDARAYLAEAVGEERVRQLEQMNGYELARAYAEADATTKTLMQNWMELGGYDMGRTYEEVINERVNEAANQQYKRFEEFALRQDEQTANLFSERGGVTTATLDSGERVIVGTNDGNETVVMDMDGTMQMVSPTRLTDMRKMFAMNLARQTTQGVAQQMQALQTAYNGTAFQADTEHTIAVSDEGVEDKAVIVGFGNNGSVAYATEYSPNKEGGYNIANRSVKEVSADEFRDMVEGAQRKAAMQQARKAEESKAVADQGIVKDGQDVTVMVGNKPTVGKYVFNAGHHFVVDAEGKVIGDFKSMDELKASMQEAQAAATAGEQMEREAELVEQSEMEKEYQRRLDEAKTTEERAAVIQEFLDQIKTDETIVLTGGNMAQVLSNNGLGARTIQNIQAKHKEVTSRGQRMGGFFVGGIRYIFADDISSIEHARSTYVHERQHGITKNNVSLLRTVMSDAGRDELLGYVHTLCRSDAYNNADHSTLADEFISMAMEVAYKYSDVEAALRQLGINNDALIQTITQLDNEQRRSDSLAQARRGEGRNLHVGDNAERGGRPDGQNQGREPGDVEEQRLRTPHGSNEETGGSQEVKQEEKQQDQPQPKTREQRIADEVAFVMQPGNAKFLDDRLKDAKKAKNGADNMKPSGKTHEKYDASKKAIEEKQKEADDELRFWQEVKSTVDEAQLAGQTRLNEADQALKDLDGNLNPNIAEAPVTNEDKEPANGLEFIADQLTGFAKKEYRINKESLKKETGWGDEEAKRFSQITAVDGGMSVQEMAEYIYGESESEGHEHGWFKDPMDARDQLLDLLQTAGDYGGITSYISENRRQAKADETQMAQQAMDYEAHQLGYEDAQDMHDKRMAEAQAKLEELKDPQGNLSEEALQQFKDFTQGLMIGQEETPAEQPTESIEGGEEFIQPTNEEAPFSVVTGNSSEEEQEETYFGEEPRYSVVTDPQLLEELNNGKTVKVYRAMQMQDGKLYPPMAGKINGEWQTPAEAGQWMQADEHPELVDDKGRFVLNKGNGKTIKAKYNPYWHTSRSPLNDQFSSAWSRPELVTVEVEIPESELTSGYKANKAKDAVGEMDWHSGPVSSQLSKKGNPRKVILSRYNRLVRVVPNEEVAERIAEMLGGTNIKIPFNTVTPELRQALEAHGVKIGKPQKGNAGDASMDAYNEWKNGGTRYSVTGLITNEQGEIDYDRVTNLAKSVTQDNKGSVLDGQGNDARRIFRVPSVYLESSGVPETAAAIIARGDYETVGAQDKTAVRVAQMPQAVSFRRRVRSDIESWAKDQGYWFDDERLTNGFTEIEGGTESRVFESDDKTKVRKLTSFTPAYSDYMQRLVENIGIFNTVFPESRYDIVGFGQDKDGNLALVVEQPLVDGYSLQDYAEQNGITDVEDLVDDIMERRGFVKYGYGTYTNGEVYVSDIIGNNILLDSKGQPYIIDAVTSLDAGAYSEPFVLYSVVNSNQAIFVSNAARAIEGIKQEKATPEQWLKMIEKNGGLKAGEDKWLGLSQWLKESKAKTLTKQEVLDFINENMVQVEEVEYGGSLFNINSKQNLESDIARAKEEGESVESVLQLWDKMYGMGLVEAYQNGEFTIDENGKVNIDQKMLQPINSTRMQYTTEGLDNKREIALTVPTIEPWNTNDEIHFGDAGEGRAVAWIRFGETTDSDGNHVLVIDEIQSKRHQEGREKGYNDPNAKVLLDKFGEAFDKWKDYRDSLAAKYNIDTYELFYTDRQDVLSEDEKERDKELADAMETARAKHDNYLKEHNLPINEQGIPAAPFEKNWMELAMKRMLRLAAEEGYDKVAWTTGEQQGERYSLGKFYDTIGREDKDDNYRRYVLSGDNVDEIVIDEQNRVVESSVSEAEGKPLSEVVGMDMAVKMENMNDGDELSGNELRIGGEGMKGFYDKMIPSFMNKYGKQWGVKVGEVTMPNLEEGYQTMHSIDVTDAMKESVMGGQLMFSVVSPESQAIFDKAKEIFGTTSNINEAGYILPDGAMLDFSGRKDLDEGTDDDFLRGRRTEDHRDIQQIEYEKDGNTKSGVNTDMPDFIRRGAIRIDSNAGVINLAVKPTQQQRWPIRRIVEANDGDVQVDFGDGWDSDHYVEYEGAKPSRVLADIDRYFDEGVKPEGNAMYSIVGQVINRNGDINYEELDNIIRGQRNELAGLSRIPEEAVGRAVATPAIAAEAIARGVRQTNLAEVWGEDRAREHTRELIKQWAKQSGYWYDEARLKEDATEGRGGTESRVFVTNNGKTVRKLTSPVFSQGDVEPYIESLHLFGNVFGESAYDIKGFGENDKGELCVVIEQPYIQGVRLSDSGITKSIDKIREFMESLGFKEYGVSMFENDKYRVEDVNRTNVIVDANGDFHVIDAYVSLADESLYKEEPMYSFVGRSGAQRLDMADRAMTRLNNLHVAREMEEQGKDAKTIKLATGWERGKDGKWRYEISDENYRFDRSGLTKFWRDNPVPKEMRDLVLKKGRTEEETKRLEDYIKERQEKMKDFMDHQLVITLEDVISHDELFKAYPQLKNIKVTFADTNSNNYDRSKGTLYGYYDDGNKEIVINKDLMNSKKRSTLIHEIQHAIQYIEGFSQGGNPSYVARAVKDMDNNAKIWAYKLALDEAAEEHPEHAGDHDALLNDILDGLTEEQAISQGWIPDKNLRGQAYKIYEGRIKGDSYENSYNRWYDKLREAGRTNFFEGTPFDLYKRLAGEVEARNTQARLDMTYQERLESLAKETEDVAREDQLIMMAGDPILYSVTANEDTDMGRPTMKEITTEYLWKLAEQQQNDWLARADAVTAFNQLLAETMLEMRNMGKADKLSKKTQGQIRRATEGTARAQERFDKAKAEKVMRMAQMMMRYGNMDSLTRGEVNRLMSAMKNAIEPQGMFEQAQKVIDIMVQHQLRDAAKVFGKQLRTKTSKLNASGVEVQAGLDLQGQHIIKVLRDAIKIKDVAEFNEKLRDAMDGMGSDSKTKSENASLDYAGLLLAKQYIESVRDNAEQEKAIKKDLKDKRAEIYDEDGKLKPEFKGKLDEEHARIKKEVQQYEDAASERLRDLRMERIDAYARLSKDLADVISGSRDRAKEWAEREMERAREIQHNANSDLQGIPAREQPRTRKELSFGERVAGSGLTQLLTASTRNFNEYLRFFGDKSPDGRGYLWNRFMPQVTEARDSEWVNLQYELSRLNAKVAELTNGKAQDVADLMAMGRKMPTITVSYRDGDEITPHEMTQGEALYIYMVNKMSDGAMKLRSMGITEEDVRDIESQLDDTFLEFADWVQEDYLPSIRERYNEVHQRMFGAPMANITDYFPLKINSDSREKEEQLGVEFDKDMPSTVTGAIIARKHNNTALNLKSDAMSVLIQHVMEMEHWAAYAELSRDLGTLLSYKRFRNRAKNMSSARLGGAARVNANGKEDKSNIFENFKKTCNIVCGTFSPTSKTDEIDKQVRNIVKGVTAAKINFRLYTAAKQITSAPAFWTKAAPQDIAKNLFPILTKDTDTGKLMTTWRWAIENLPGFAKRWQSRQAGNEMLDTTDTDWGIWKNKFVAAAGRIGMTPNAFVDAMTVIAGSKAVFDTSFRRYKNAGYSEKEAKKKALLDASVAYNESQQSQDPAYLSIMQANRTFLNSAFSLFRNSSFGYWRNYTRAIHNIKKMSKKGYKEETLEFLTKQAMRDGLTEEQAKKLASKTYNRQWYRSIADVALFGFIIEFAWNIAPYAVYLLGGDDKDKKREMLTDAARHSAFGSIEGMPGGNIASTFINDLLAGRDVSSFSYHLLPILSDIEKIKSEYATDKVAMANDIIGLLLSSFSGVDPRGISDIVVAIMDACNGDPELSIGAALLIMRIAEVPQSQLDELMIDEIGMTAGEARRLPADQVAKRYANYKLHRNAPLTSWAYDDEAKQKKLTKYENVLLKKAEDRLNSMSDEDAATYFDETDDITVKSKMAKGIYSEYGLDKDYEGAKPTKSDSETTTRKKITYQKMRTLEDVKEDAALRSYMSGLDHESSEYKAVSKDKKELDKAKEFLGDKKDENDKKAMERYRSIRKKIIDKYNIEVK